MNAERFLVPFEWREHGVANFFWFFLGIITLL